MRATVITDASWCPRSGAGGWAAWITFDGGRRIKQGGAFHRAPANSSEAEMWASLNGVAIAGRNGATHVLLQTDCMDVVHKIKSRNKKAIYFSRKYGVTNVYAKHVKGHTTHVEPRYYCNRWCDKTAKHHMRQQRGDYATDTRSDNARQDCKI